MKECQKLLIAPAAPPGWREDGGLSAGTAADQWVWWANLANHPRLKTRSTKDNCSQWTWLTTRQSTKHYQLVQDLSTSFSSLLWWDFARDFRAVKHVNARPSLSRRQSKNWPMWRIWDAEMRALDGFWVCVLALVLTAAKVLLGCFLNAIGNTIHMQIFQWVSQDELKSPWNCRLLHSF